MLFDTAIIGAGPAGSTAASLLSQWGHRVALFSRPQPQRSLAESLPPSCAKLFDTIGIREIIEDGEWIRATGNTVHWGGDPPRVEMFGRGQTGLQVERSSFDAVLLDHARGSGAQLLLGAAARAVCWIDAEQLWTVAYDADGESRTIRAQWVLDCSGRAGLVARQGMRRPEAGLRTVALVGVWERGDSWDVPDATHTIVESYDGGWAWSVPVSVHRRYVTVMIDPTVTPIPGRSQLAAAYAAELARTEALAATVAGSALVGEPWACDASPYTADRFVQPGLLLVGDAGSFVDPLSSFGVKKALASAWLGAVVVHSTLEDESMTGQALELFEARERTMYDQLRRQTAALFRDAQVVHASEFWRERSAGDIPDTSEALDVAALRTDPRVLAAFAAIRSRPSLQLSLSPSVRMVKRPTVDGNRLVLGDHLVTPEIGRGVRYLRSIDLVLLSRLASTCDQVPDLFAAYNRTAPPAPLPDFLGALSVLVGLDVLSLA